jgi:hypothetical protein
MIRLPERQDCFVLASSGYIRIGKEYPFAN